MSIAACGVGRGGGGFKGGDGGSTEAPSQTGGREVTFWDWKFPLRTPLMGIVMTAPEVRVRRWSPCHRKLVKSVARWYSTANLH